NRVEVAGEVALDNPASGSTALIAVLQLKLHRANRVVYATGRSEAVRSRMEITLPDRLHRHQHCPLHDPVPQTRDTEWSELVVQKLPETPHCRALRSAAKSKQSHETLAQAHLLDIIRPSIHFIERAECVLSLINMPPF